MNEFKCHPLMIFRFLKPLLLILTLPVIKGFIRYITRSDMGNLVLWESIIALCIVILGVVGWKSYKISIKNGEITVKRGILFKRIARIKLCDISSAKVTQGITDRIFNSVNFAINTEAGGKHRADFIFKLSLSDGERLSALLYGESGNVAVKFSLLKLALMSAATSSVITGIIVSVPIIKRTGDLLGIAIDEMLLERINKTASAAKNYFPPIVNALTIGLALFYVVAFCYSLFKYVNFKLRADDEKISVSYGFIAKQKTIFKKRAIKNIIIEQTPLMRCFRLFSVSASVGGFGSSRRETAAVIPCVNRENRKQLLKQIFGGYEENREKLRTEKSESNRNRFLFKPLIFSGCVVGLVVSAVVIFDYFDRLMLFLMLISMLLILYYADLCVYNYKNTFVAVGEKTVAAKGIRGFRVKELICSKERVGEVKLIRYPADIRHGTCKIKLTVRSEGAQKIKVLNVDYEKALSLTKRIKM